MAIEVALGGAEDTVRQFERLAPDALNKAIRAAAKRAAVAARTAGTKHVRQIYTIRSGDMKERTQIFTEESGVTLKVKGRTEPVQKYKAAERRRGIFVAIKRASGSIVPRSFAMPDGVYVQRRGAARFPIKGLHGPAVPQLFGNDAVIAEMKERAGEVFENRLYHEMGRLLGVT